MGVGLSDLERAVLTAFLHDQKRGWKARVAKEQEVSRMAVTYAWLRVEKKLKELYLKRAA